MAPCWLAGTGCAMTSSLLSEQKLLTAALAQCWAWAVLQSRSPADHDDKTIEDNNINDDFHYYLHGSMNNTDEDDYKSNIHVIMSMIFISTNKEIREQRIFSFDVNWNRRKWNYYLDHHLFSEVLFTRKRWISIQIIISSTFLVCSYIYNVERRESLRVLLIPWWMLHQFFSCLAAHLLFCVWI